MAQPPQGKQKVQLGDLLQLFQMFSPTAGQAGQQRVEQSGINARATEAANALKQRTEQESVMSKIHQQLADAQDQQQKQIAEFQKGTLAHGMASVSQQAAQGAAEIATKNRELTDRAAERDAVIKQTQDEHKIKLADMFMKYGDPELAKQVALKGPDAIAEHLQAKQLQMQQMKQMQTMQARASFDKGDVVGAKKLLTDDFKWSPNEANTTLDGWVKAKASTVKPLPVAPPPVLPTAPGFSSVPGGTPDKEYQGGIDWKRLLHLITPNQIAP